MDPITLDLQAEATQQQGRPWQMYIFMGLGISNFFQGMSSHNEFRYYNIALGAAMFAGAAVYQYFYKPRILLFDDDGISGRLSRHHTINIPWTEISRIDVKLFDIVVHLRTGTHLDIDISSCTYLQHHDIKPKIIDLAKRKLIDVGV